MSTVEPRARDGTRGRDGGGSGTGGRGGPGVACRDGTGGSGRGEPAGGGDERDRGAVTVEGAITVCSLIVVLGLVLGVVTAMLDQARCADAAGEAARLLGRGDDARAREAVERLAPDGATLTATGDGTGIVVTVRSPILGGLLPGTELAAEAYAIREPGTEGAAASEAEQ
ncbi:TadE family type IV pilus minor pilin [Prauserella alba]|uniref:TadE-like protein n=1 Tax=Prauserella alba TaxID=176898 RepID=A0ABN1VBS3_9PSEU|nr:TadE family type IV pilus minor pilin [Prauserella alba]MCP2181640.1 hypothetical protein [Prauserella alba]